MGFRGPSLPAPAPLSQPPVNQSASIVIGAPHDGGNGNIAVCACKRFLNNGLIWDSYDWT